MPATKVSCPRCSRPLISDKALPAGTPALCPGCGAAFTVPGPSSSTAGIRREAPTASADLPARVPLPSADQPLGRGKKWLALAAIGGAFFLLFAATAVAVFLAARARDTRTADDPAITAGDTGTVRVPDPVPSSGGDRTPGETPPPRPSAEPPPPPWLPPDRQAQVDRAIERGIAYLKKAQTKEGVWFAKGYHHGGYRVGQTALPALTLLTCGVPPDDPHVREAASYVRSRVKGLDKTYDIALALLFLDRLGDPADEAHIRTLAVRLVAGQTATGGWDYGCPRDLTSRQELALLTVLEDRKPTSPLDLFVAAENGRPAEWIASKPEDFLPAGKPRQGGTHEGPPRSVFGGGPRGPSPRSVQDALEALPEKWKRLPVLQPPEQSHRMPAHSGNADNSNTQFATLALWAARRRGLTVDRALALVVQRFRTSQNRDGNWDYHYHQGGSSNHRSSMTGAGLLGLAVGHGLVAPSSPGERKDAPRDEAVERGLKAFAAPIGTRDQRRLVRHADSGGLYYLWTVERVGMLYSLRTIDGKDWYGWGSDLLVKHQAKNGCWDLGGYYGSEPLIDTAFALLFLRRADLATDLSKSVEFLTAGKQGR